MVTIDSQIDEFVENAALLVPATVLLRILDKFVREFVDVRMRLRDSHAVVWNRLSEELTGFEARLSPARNPIPQVCRLEKRLNDDKELGAVWASYRGGLVAISMPLGFPARFVDVMLARDLSDFFRASALGERVVDLVSAPEAGEPGTWTGEVHHAVDYMVKQMAGVKSTAELLEPGASTAARHQMEKFGRQVAASLSRPDPILPIAYWVGMRVLGNPARDLGESGGHSEMWVRKQGQHASTMLGLQARRGRPKVGMLPVAAWRRMNFATPKIGLESR